MKHRTRALFPACAMLGSSALSAQSRPITPFGVSVAFPPGGAADLVAVTFMPCVLPRVRVRNAEEPIALARMPR